MIFARAGARPIASSPRSCRSHLHQLRNLISRGIPRVRNIRLGIRRYTNATPFEEPLAPNRVTTILPNAVVIIVGAPSPILKETPTGLWSRSTCNAKENWSLPKCCLSSLRTARRALLTQFLYAARRPIGCRCGQRQHPLDVQVPRQQRRLCREISGQVLERSSSFPHSWATIKQNG
jgi:hypothetical protein